LSKVRFTVLGQPQGKGRAKASSLGGKIRMRTPEKTVLYENWVRESALMEMSSDFIPFTGQLLATVDMYYQIPKSGSKKVHEGRLNGIIKPTTKPDLDNVMKAIFDSLNGIVYKDDSQIVRVVAEKHYSDTPRVEVTITEM
jgi:Holliday junction resolvase RusA-like endonuclease